MAESEELKSPLMKVKEKSKKVGLKLSIQKTKIMASSPITSQQIDGETLADFIFGGSKITADGDCSHEIKRLLLYRRQGLRLSPWKRNAKKAKWLSEEALQIAMKRREVKSKGEKESYSHLNAEFQRIARRD